MIPQNKLYEAAKAVTRLRFISHPFVVLREAITAYEQEQLEAIAGEKTKTEIWHEWDSRTDLSPNDAAYGAMLEYASQQTSAKDKEIAELKQRISELEKTK